MIGEETLYALEWERVINIAADLAASPLGAERLLALEVPVSKNRAELLLVRTQEMVRVLTETDGGLPIDGLSDIQESLSRAGIEGASLDPLELRKIAETVMCCESRAQSTHIRAKPICPNLQDSPIVCGITARSQRTIESAIDA